MISQEHRLEMKETRRKQVRTSLAQERITMESHKEHLASEYGLVGHPKLDLLYSKAWDLGHSSGFSEVECHFTDLLELIR